MGRKTCAYPAIGPSPPSARTAIAAPECGAVSWEQEACGLLSEIPEFCPVAVWPKATCTAPIAANSTLCVFFHDGLYRKAYSRGFRVWRCVALIAGPKARAAGSSVLRVAAGYPGDVGSAERKTRPHRRFARTVAPLSLVTRHLPLPVHLKLRQRLPRFASGRSSRML